MDSSCQLPLESILLRIGQKKRPVFLHYCANDVIFLVSFKTILHVSNFINAVNYLFSDPRDIK